MEFFNSSPYMHFLGVLFKFILMIRCVPFHYMMHVYPPLVFASESRVVTAGPMLFYALLKHFGGLRGCTVFISIIVSRWDVIRW